ncbi:MAG: AsmA-like C-terminal domain-containing protein [Proteobacteria bacterium]|nr:AsmA-like C-terminal domain-containing protein [Pseudomonadota bacterium]
MKKTFRNIFLLLAVLAVIIGLAPRLLVLEQVHRKITAQLSASLDSSVTVKELNWAWLPLPHMSISDIRITNDEIDITVPKTRVYPHWSLLLGKTRKPGSVTLLSPAIHIKKNYRLGQGVSDLIMPQGRLNIENGTLQIDIADEYHDIFRSDTLIFKSIQSKINLQSQGAYVDLQASAPFSDKLALQGKFNSEKQSYSFSVDFQEVKLHKTFKSFAEGTFIPVESTARLQGSVVGRGLEQIEADITGVLPCFVVKPEDKQILINCGYAHFIMHKSGTLMRLNIKDLEVKEPKLNLAGQVERRLPTPGKVTAKDIQATEDPVWLLDLTGGDLDLTAIREKILTLWGNNEIAKIVCDIVLGGKALSARYQFSGVAKDFENLSSMTITAEAQNADIHVPGAELDLTRARGPIVIKNSILTGYNLGATMGNSQGSNGNLFLDLKEGANGFTLDLDIDADVAALPGVLGDLIEHDGFLRELQKFHDASGRAKGHLRLGDTLDNIVTEVSVNDMDFTTRYDPIPQTISIHQGKLEIKPEEVSWQDVGASIGEQQIKSTSGTVNWESDQTKLNIDQLNATLDSNSLLQTLTQTNVTPSQIADVLTGLDGKVELSDTSLQGPAFSPEDWQYNLMLRTNGLTINSPLLPESAYAKLAEANFTDNEVKLSKSDIHFLDQPININGVLQHTLLDDWQGWIELNGPLMAKMAGWVSSNGWFPEQLRPRIPCTLRNMKVSWSGESIGVSGNILKGMEGGRLPMARIKFQNTPERLHIQELSFFAPGEQGGLTLDLRRQSPARLHFTWDGFAHAETIDSLFHYNNFLSGTYSGAFSFSYQEDRPDATVFEGLLKAKDLVWMGDEQRLSAIIRNLDVNGIGKQMKITGLDIEVGAEKLSAHGQIATVQNGIDVDIDLLSSHFSKDSLTQLLSEMRQVKKVFHGSAAETGSTEESLLPVAWDFTGRMGFEFDSFSMNRETSAPYSEARPVNYTLHELRGNMELAPDEIYRTEISSSKLCGMDFTGYWFSDDNMGQKFTLFTDPDQNFYFQNVLPCLGIEQNFIEGVFNLQADLYKESGVWYNGHVHIQSPQGRILKLKTLAKIFSIVNITDLLDPETLDLSKKGFPYSRMDIDTHIEKNRLILERAVVHGEGLNLFAKGDMNMDDLHADITLLIAPLKSIDSLISKVPIIGEPIIGEDGSIVAIPVTIKGPLNDPKITALHPEAVGDAVWGLVKDTMMLPFNILKQGKKTIGAGEKK